MPYYPSFYPQEIRIEPLDPAAAAKEFLNKTPRSTSISGRAPRFDGKAPSFSSRSRRWRPSSSASASRAKPRWALPGAGPGRGGRGERAGHGRSRLPRHALPCRLPRPRRPRAEAGGRSGRPHRRRRVEHRGGAGRRRSCARQASAPAFGGPALGQGRVVPGLSSAALRGRRSGRGERADKLYERLTLGSFKDQAERLNLEREPGGGAHPGLRARRHRLPAAARGSSATTSPTASRTSPRLAIGPQLAHRRAHRQAQGLPLERLAAPRHRRARPRRPGTRSPASPTRIGRLVWSTVGDDAYLPVTYNSRWVQNRAEVVPDDEERKPSQSMLVPADALMPQAETGKLAAVGAGKGAMGKIVYRVSASAFQDGTEMEPADLVYPYALAFRWGEGGPAGATFDPHIAAATRLLRERLAGVRCCESRARAADRRSRVPLSQPGRGGVPRRPSGDEEESADRAALELRALARAGADGGRGRAQLAAFSEGEAARRGIPWLDLVRDKAKLARAVGAVRRVREERLSPGRARGPRRRRRGAGALAGAEEFLGGERPSAGGQRPLPARELTPRPGLQGRPRDHLSGGHRHLRSFRLSARPSSRASSPIGSAFLISADIEIAVKERATAASSASPSRRALMRVTYPIQPTARYVVVGGDGKVRPRPRQVGGRGRFPHRCPGPFPWQLHGISLRSSRTATASIPRSAASPSGRNEPAMDRQDQR